MKCQKESNPDLYVLTIHSITKLLCFEPSPGVCLAQKKKTQKTYCCDEGWHVGSDNLKDFYCVIEKYNIINCSVPSWL